MALGLRAETVVLDVNVERLRYLEHVLHGRFQTLTSTRHNIAEAVKDADLLVGAVLIPGARAPKLVSREMVATMRPGAVIVDVAIDQGGSVETIRPTMHSNPVYQEEGVIHYGVTNMPGAVPRTSTFALSNVTLPYGLQLADLGFEEAVRRDQALAKGVNVYCGHVTYRSVAEALNMPYTPLTELV
jgi:alanine dehydrogenase